MASDGIPLDVLAVHWWYGVCSGRVLCSVAFLQLIKNPKNSLKI